MYLVSSLHYIAWGSHNCKIRGGKRLQLHESIITLYGGGEGEEAFLYITKLVTKDTVTVTVIN